MRFEGASQRASVPGEKEKRNTRKTVSDAERLDDFMETGDSSVLTLEQARKMQLSAEMMAEVPGVTAEDMEAARTRDTLEQASWGGYFEKELAKLPGVKAAELDAHPARVALFLLTHRDEPRYTKFVRDFYEDLEEILTGAARSQPQVFASELTALLDFEHPASFASTSAALELVRNFYIELLHSEQDDLDVVDNDGTLQSRDPERFAALTAGSDALIKTLHRAIERRAGSYLLSERAREVLAALESRELSYEHVDGEPFLLAPGIYAGFNHDKSRLYLAPKEYSERIASYVLSTDEKRKDAWHYDAFYSDIIDAGDVFDIDACKRIGLAVSEQDLRDFYFLQSEPIRERIKSDFEIELPTLSIPEQFQLLQFLKTVEKRDASPLLLQATQRLRKMGALRLESIRGGSLEEMSGGDISREDREAMLRVQRERYAKKYPPETFDELRRELEAAFGRPDSHFYIYRKDGAIVTFVRFDAAEDGKRMASFLTNPDFEGGSLGQAMLDVALERETAGGENIVAECDPNLAPFYERFGFRIVRGPYKDESGVETCDILREAAAPNLKLAS